MADTHIIPDAEIFSAVRGALDAHPEVPQGIRVHVDHGTVTLTGSVSWAQEKSEAEAIVRKIDGVKTVSNEVIVAHAANPQGFEAPETP